MWKTSTSFVGWHGSQDQKTICNCRATKSFVAVRLIFSVALSMQWDWNKVWPPPPSTQDHLDSNYTTTFYSNRELHQASQAQESREPPQVFVWGELSFNYSSSLLLHAPKEWTSAAAAAPAEVYESVLHILLWIAVQFWKCGPLPAGYRSTEYVVQCLCMFAINYSMVHHQRHVAEGSVQYTTVIPAKFGIHGRKRNAV